MRLIIGLVLVAGCSAPYEVRLSDDKSASRGPLFFFGWVDPPLVPGTRLIDAASGSRVVLWNEAGLEAIVDIGDTCPVLVCEGDGARAPTDMELAVIDAVFPAWGVTASDRVGEYAAESRLERRFRSHIRAHVHNLDEKSVVSFALGNEPAGWMDQGGRAVALTRAASIAGVADLPRLVSRAMKLTGAELGPVVRAFLERPDLTAGELRIVASVAPDLAAAHPAADEGVCLAAIEAVSRASLSSARRKGLESILESRAVTDRVREEALKVPLSYPEDRESVRRKAAAPK